MRRTVQTTNDHIQFTTFQRQQFNKKYQAKGVFDACKNVTKYTILNTLVCKFYTFNTGANQKTLSSAFR